MPTQYPSPSDINTLDETEGGKFTYNGGSWQITSVASAGDVNGDGYDDLVVSGRTGSFNSATMVNYVVYGSADGVPDGLDLASLSASEGFRIEGTTAIKQWMAEGAGDLNGDGYADIVVGSSNDRVFDYAYEDINVIYGGANVASVVSLAALNGTNGYSLQTTGSSFNWQFSGAGDINGDGIDDLAIGQQYAARVIYGSTAAQPATGQLLDVSQTVFTPTDWYSGTSSVIGDINGDGFADMRFGEAVVFGSADGFDPTLTVADLDGTNGFRLAPTTGTYAFKDVVSAGDVNGDGIDDFIIGSPNTYAHGHIDAGEAYVVFGRDGGFDATLDLSSLDGSNGFVIRGETLWHLGTEVAGAGDVNGDGFDDVAVRTSYGDVFVVFGQAVFHGSSFDAVDLDGTHGFNIRGYGPDGRIVDLAGLGDFNGDGFSDLGFATLGWEGENGPNIYGGAVVYGQAPTGPVTLVDSAIDQTMHGGDFDDTLISYGGDDLLIGGGGNDSLRSIAGHDTMNGGLGNDEYFIFNDHSDTIIDAGGIDTIRTTSHIDLRDYASIENVTLADAGDWHVRGNDLDNRLVGGAGDNALMGGAGNDRLEGGAGVDWLIGGLGRDILIGGSGIDRFDFNTAADSQVTGGARDVIVDYEAGETFNLAKVDANSQRSGGQYFTFLGDGEFTGTAGELRYDTLTYSDGSLTTIVEGDTNGDGVGDFGFEVRGVHTFTAADFIL